MTGSSVNTKISILIFSLLTIGVTLTGFDSFVLQLVGKGAILGLLSLALLLNIKYLLQYRVDELFKGEEKKILFPLLFWIGVCFLSLSKSYGAHDLYVTCELILLISFFFFVYKKGNLLYPNHVFIGIILIIVMSNIAIVFVQNSGNLFYPFRPDGFFITRNTMATTVYYLLIILVLYRAKKATSIVGIILFVPFLYLIFVANSRAIYGALVVFLVTYFGWKYITKNKLVYYLFLYSFLFVNLLFVLVTIGFFDKILPEASLLNLYFREYTGGNLESGRQMIWPGIIEHIWKNPILGSGTGTVPSDFLATNLSSHNYYLQILLQTGVLGFSAFLWFISYTWSVFRRVRNDKIIRIVASFFISILFHQTFVVSLTQNNMEQAALFWFIIGIGLNQARKMDSQSKRIKFVLD